MIGGGIGVLELLVVFVGPLLFLRYALNIFMIPALFFGWFFKKLWLVIVAGAATGIAAFFLTGLLFRAEGRFDTGPFPEFSSPEIVIFHAVAGIEVALIVWLLHRLIRRFTGASRGPVASQEGLGGEPE